jgi:hypothetical protein
LIWLKNGLVPTLLLSSANEGIGVIMKFLLIIGLLIISSGAYATSAQKNSVAINAKNSQIENLKETITALNKTDNHLQNFNSKLINRGHLLNNMFIVGEKNDDSLQDLTYFIEEEFLDLQLFSENLKNLTSPAEAQKALEEIQILTKLLGEQLSEMTEISNKAEIKELIAVTLSTYKTIAVQIVDMQFYISLACQDNQSEIAGLQKQIKILQEPEPVIRKNIGMRPQDSKYYWSSRGMIEP